MRRLHRRYGHMVSATRWYVVMYKYPKKGQRSATAYGPFEGQEAAEKAGYFARPVEERDRAAAAREIRSHLARGVQGFEDEEIAAIARTPEEFGFSSFRVRAAGALKAHASWSGYDEPFRDDLFRRDVSAR